MQWNKEKILTAVAPARTHSVSQKMRNDSLHEYHLAKVSKRKILVHRRKISVHLLCVNLSAYFCYDALAMFSRDVDYAHACSAFADSSIAF